MPDTITKPSRTSMWVAASRALGAREPDAACRNPDVLAEALLGDVASTDLDHPVVHALARPYEEAMQDAEVLSNVRMMTVRTRFIDECLAHAVAADARQVVILGAGFDSHAYRCAELLRDVRVFEVDRPSTQALKQARVHAVLGGAPSNVTYVPVDFDRERLSDALPRHGCDSRLRTFFIMEGVTMYLPEEAVRRTFEFVATFPPGSRIVFDYVYQPMIDMLARIDPANVPEPARPFVKRFLHVIRDEPWQFGMPFDGEAEFIASCGLTLGEHLAIGGDEAARRYLTRSDGTIMGAATMAAATAQMADRMRAAGHAEEAQRSTQQQRVMAYQIAVAGR